MIINTKRLLIRDIDMEDKEAIFEYRSDTEANKFQSWVPKTLEDVATFIEINKKKLNKPGSWYQVLITDKKTSAVIGDIGIHFFGVENLQVELGITLHQSFQGKGYALEALEGVIDFLFNNFNKHRIIASVDPANQRSIALMEKIGFRKEGYFVKSLFWKNSWVDDIIFAILCDEWKKITSINTPYIQQIHD